MINQPASRPPTARGDLVQTLMIQSIFAWPRAKPSLLCRPWNIHTPAVAWHDSRKSFSLLSLTVKQSDLLSLLVLLLLLLLLCTQLESLNPQSTIHMEGFYSRLRRYANFYRVSCFSPSPSCPPRLFFFSPPGLDTPPLPLSAFQSSTLKSASHQLRSEI